MKKVVIVIILLSVLGGGVGWYQFTKKVPTLVQQVADYELSADALFDAFDADETAALRAYENKIIKVRGEIMSIKNEGQVNNVILYSENAMAGGVNCAVNEKITGLQIGEMLTLKGRCQGFLMNVILNNCHIES